MKWLSMLVTLLGGMGLAGSASALQAQTRSGVDCLPWGNPGPNWSVVSTGSYGPANHGASSLTMQCPMGNVEWVYNSSNTHSTFWSGYDRHGSASVAGSFCEYSAIGTSATCASDSSGGTVVGVFADRPFSPALVNVESTGYFVLTVVLPAMYSGDVSRITSYRLQQTS